MFTQPVHWLSPLKEAQTGRMLTMPAQFSDGRYDIKAGYGAVDAAQNDTIGLFLIDSHALFSTVVSLIEWDALGAGVTGDIGFAADAEIGYAGAEDVLAAAIAMTNAGSSKLVPALTINTRYKKAWEIAGLTEDPHRQLLVQLKLEGANPAAGDFFFEQAYTIGR